MTHTLPGRAYTEEFQRSPGQRLLLLCDWLPPDFGAVGQYILIRAGELAADGHHVVVYGFSTEARATTLTRHGSGTLKVVYLAQGAYDKNRLLRRAWWTLGANWRLLRACRADYRHADEVIFSGSPPYMLHFIAWVNLWRRRPLVYRISDFHPECLMAEYPRPPLWLRMLHRLTLFWRKRVQMFEVLGHDQARRLREQGVPDERIRLLRDPSPVTFQPPPATAAPPAALSGKRILLYSGNFGVAHEHHTVCAALAHIERLHPGQVGLWLNAVGKKADLVELQLRSSGVAVARTAPVELDQLAGVLLAADCHLICLRDEFVGYVLPSKVYACIASGRPVLYIGSTRSDVHQLCLQQCEHYAQVTPGDVAAAAAALVDLLKISPNLDD